MATVEVDLCGKNNEGRGLDHLLRNLGHLMHSHTIVENAVSYTRCIGLLCWV